MDPQVILNGVAAGCQYAFVAVGITLILKVGRFFHFAIGGIYVAGAYAAFAASHFLNSGLVLAALSCVLATSALGVACELGVYRVLRQRRASPLSLLIASLGLLIVLQNGVALCFGNSIKSLKGKNFEALEVWDFRISSARFLSLIGAAILLFVVYFLIYRTRWGKMMRAVACNEELSIVVGIPRDEVFVKTFIVSSVAAGAGAFLHALDFGLTPMMGLRATLMAVVAVVIGGVGSILGAFLGAIMLGLIENLSAWFLSTRWQDLSVFIVLILFLVIRPNGLFGLSKDVR